MQVPGARESGRQRSPGTDRRRGLERAEMVKVRVQTGRQLLQKMNFCLQDKAE